MDWVFASFFFMCGVAALSITYGLAKEKQVKAAWEGACATLIERVPCLPFQGARGKRIVRCRRVDARLVSNILRTHGFSTETPRGKEDIVTLEVRYAT